jgi:high-affinity Fe2+/Pb2+ permease
MDIIILFLLFFIGLAIWRGAPRWLILTCWVGTLLLMIGLFRFHVTSVLDLSF